MGESPGAGRGAALRYSLKSTAASLGMEGAGWVEGSSQPGEERAAGGNGGRKQPFGRHTSIHDPRSRGLGAACAAEGGWWLLAQPLGALGQDTPLSDSSVLSQISPPTPRGAGAMRSQLCLGLAHSRAS